MKSTKIKVLSLLLVVVMVFTGCANIEETVKINKDGSAKITAVTEIQKEALLELYGEMMKEMYGYEVPASMIESTIEQQFKDQGVKLIEKDGVEYYQETESQNLNNKQLNNSFSSETGESQAWITGDTFYVDLKATEAMGDSGMTADFSQYEDFAKKYADSITMTFKIEFTAPIVSISSTGKISEENPNQAVFEFKYSNNLDKLTMFATTNSKVTVSTVKASIKKANTVKAPKKIKVKAQKVSKKAKTATVKYSYKKASGAKGYEIEYSTKKNMKNSKVIVTKKAKGTIKKLKKGKKYYVRIRSYKENYAGITVYSKWSSKKSVKTKKSK